MHSPSKHAASPSPVVVVVVLQSHVVVVVVVAPGAVVVVVVHTGSSICMLPQRVSVQSPTLVGQNVGGIQRQFGVVVVVVVVDVVVVTEW